MIPRICVTLPLSPLDAGWRPLFPRLEFEMYQDGDCLIIKRWLAVGGGRRTSLSFTTENVSHILNQAGLQMEAEEIGYVRPL
jgi:N-dimethylarginine dimethylaminohydrolase